MAHPSRLEILRELMALDDQYEEIVGHNAYLFARSIDGTAHFFFIEQREVDSPEAALAHMRSLMHDLAAELSGGQ